MTVDRIGTLRQRSFVSGDQSSTCLADGGLNALISQVAKSGNLQAADENGMALIHHAACHGNLTLIRKLHSLGADLNLSDGGSPPWRPIHYAIFHRQPAAEQVLRALGVPAPLPIVHRVAQTLPGEHGRPVLTIQLRRPG